MMVSLVEMVILVKQRGVIVKLNSVTFEEVSRVMLYEPGPVYLGRDEMVFVAALLLAPFAAERGIDVNAEEPKLAARMLLEFLEAAVEYRGGGGEGVYRWTGD